jgi:hypothetical protein
MQFFASAHHAGTALNGPLSWWLKPLVRSSVSHWIEASTIEMLLSTESATPRETQSCSRSCISSSSVCRYSLPSQVKWISDGATLVAVICLM